jgi:cysteinyl-tRNA synthetase
MKYLGQTFDIHGGGLENQFPHHECEIAQSESANGKPFVRYWVHNNMVTVNGQKMSKSLGNFVTLKDAFRKFDPLVVRFFVLQSHYRSTLDFSDEALVGAKTGWEKLIGTIRNVRAEITKAAQDGVVANVDLVGFKARFLESMNDDFNTPKAIAALFDLSRDVNQLLNSGAKVNAASLKAIDDFYAEYGGKILGIVPDQSSTRTSSDGALEPGLIQLLLDMRDEARKQKMWALSDLIRDRLKSLGVVIEDKKDGATWKLVR